MKKFIMRRKRSVEGKDDEGGGGRRRRRKIYDIFSTCLDALYFLTNH
jgi:hypothetical protein